MVKPWIRFKSKEVSTGCRNAITVDDPTPHSTLSSSGCYAGILRDSVSDSFPFLSLPPELRDIIYGFTAQEYVTQSRQASISLVSNRRDYWPRAHQALDSIVPPVMQACNQLHQEFLKHYLASGDVVRNDHITKASARGMINTGRLLITNVTWLRLDLPVTVCKLDNGRDYSMVNATLRVKYDACQSREAANGPYLRIWLDGLHDLYLDRIALTTLAMKLTAWTHFDQNLNIERALEISYFIQGLGKELGLCARPAVPWSCSFWGNAVQLRYWDQRLYIWLARFETGIGAVYSVKVPLVTGSIGSATRIDG